MYEQQELENSNEHTKYGVLDSFGFKNKNVLKFINYLE